MSSDKIEILRLVDISTDLTEELKLKFYSLDPTSDVRVILETIIRGNVSPMNKPGKLSATEALIVYIKKLYNENSLYAISICLREGADVNTYVNDPSLGITGSIHILAYLHIVGKNVSKNIFELAMFMLLASGSSPLKTAFVDGPNIVRPHNGTINSESVLEWLRHKGMGEILASVHDKLSTSLSPQTLKIVAILTCRLDLLPNDFTLSTSDTITAILARSDSRSCGGVEIVDKFASPEDDIDSRVMIEAIFNYDLRAINHYICKGATFSYPLTNVVLLDLINYATVPTIRNILGNMLTRAVEHGLEMDSDQQTLLSAAGVDIYQHVISAYTTPHWKKQCAGTNEFRKTVSPKLVSVADNLGFSGGSLCVFFNNIFLSDKSALLQSLSNRQKARVGSRYGYINEFSSTRPPMLEIVNNSNAYDYVDNYIVFYRDINSRTWAWTSEQFKFLLKTAKNPSTDLSLPTFVLEEIEQKLEKISDPRRPLTWEMLIDIITQADVINNDTSNAQLEKMFDDLVNRGVSKMLMLGLTAQQLSAIMCAARCDYRIDELTTGHALISFAYIYNYYLDNNPMLIQSLVEGLKSTRIEVPKWEVTTGLEIPIAPQNYPVSERPTISSVPTLISPPGKISESSPVSYPVPQTNRQTIYTVPSIHS